MTTTTTTTTTRQPAGTAPPFAPILGAKYVLLTTFRRDGTPVGTPVHVVAHGDVAVFRSFTPSGKLKRIMNNPDVEVAPCTAKGRVTGPAVAARARLLGGAEGEAVAHALSRKHPVVHRFLIPWYHRRTGRTTVHLELVPR
jgi:uncharacterized protein